MKEVREIILSALEANEQSQNPSSPKFKPLRELPFSSSSIHSVSKLYQSIVSHDLSKNLSRISLESTPASKEHAIHAHVIVKDIQSVLHDALYSIVRTLIESNIKTSSQYFNSNYRDSIQRTVKFAAQVAFVPLARESGISPEFKSLGKWIVNEILPLINIQVESIRLVMVETVHESLKVLHYYNEMQVEPEVKACLDTMVELLEKRLRDKSQSIRQASLTACRTILHLPSTTSYPSLMNQVLFSLVHDSSSVNRSTALQVLPCTNETIPYIVERTRDAKVKVRLEALENLKCINVHELSVEQRIDILTFGLSTRYDDFPQTKCYFLVIGSLYSLVFSINERYPATHLATAKLLCCNWMKTCKFSPIATLALLDPSVHECIASLAARAFICAAHEDFDFNSDESRTMVVEGANISPEITLCELSANEIQEYRNQVMTFTSTPVLEDFACKEKSGSWDKNEDLTLTPATLVFLKVLCDVISKSKVMSPVQKSTMLSIIMPDVTIIGQVLESHVGKVTCTNETLKEAHLMEESVDEIQRLEQLEEDDIFVCMTLLKLTNFVDLTEEGSRRHFSSLIHRLLCHVETPQELIEGCVEVMAKSHDTEPQFLQSISEALVDEEDEIVDSRYLQEEKKEPVPVLKKKKQYLRNIEIISVALEKTSNKMSSHPILHNFSEIILTAITDMSLGPLVREAGVSCLGRFVLLLDESTVVEQFKPLLMEVAMRKDEKSEIRGQAVMAICDLCFLFDRMMTPLSLEEDGEEVSITTLFSHALLCSNKAFVVVAAECAVKLFFGGKLHDSTILANLVVLYFDKDFAVTDRDMDETEDEDANAVGSPERLQQVLTLFFPSFSLRSSEGREMMLKSIKPLLKIVNGKISTKKRGKRSTVWPLSKMIEYVCAIVENGEEKAECIKKDKGMRRVDETSNRTSPVLRMSVGITEFLVSEFDNVTITSLRSLCKILNKAYIDVKVEDCLSLTSLKRNLDELSMLVTDENATRSLEDMIELLDEVEYTEDEHDEDDNMSLSHSSNDIGMDDESRGEVERFMEEASYDGETDEESTSQIESKLKSVGKSGAKAKDTLVGRRIAKKFSQGIFIGAIEDEPNASSRYWFVRYDDGDSEEMERREVNKAMRLYEQLNDGNKEEEAPTENQLNKSCCYSDEEDDPLFASL